MNGPCMCGDTHCHSCGPAQGNWKCPICRAWADDGCEHIGEDGNPVAEFLSQFEAIARDEAAAEAAYAADIIEEDQLIDAWIKQGKL